MSVLGILIPVAILGVIFWAVAGVRARNHEPVTLAGVTSLYAHLMQVVAASMALVGAALVVKVVLGYINTNFAYGGSFSGGVSCSSINGGPQTCSPPPTIDSAPQRTQDLVLALTLIVVGVLVFVLHRLLARSLRSLPGGQPTWVVRGTSIAYPLLWAPAALVGVVGAAYGIIAYVVVPAGTSPNFGASIGAQPFADLLGAAVAFVPAWVMSIFLLRRTLHRAPLAQPPAVS